MHLALNRHASRQGVHQQNAAKPHSIKRQLAGLMVELKDAAKAASTRRRR